MNQTQQDDETKSGKIPTDGSLIGKLGIPGYSSRVAGSK